MKLVLPAHCLARAAQCATLTLMLLVAQCLDLAAHCLDLHFVGLALYVCDCLELALSAHCRERILSVLQA